MTSSKEDISHRQINIKHADIWFYETETKKTPEKKFPEYFFSNYFTFYSLLYYCFYSIFGLTPETNSQVLWIKISVKFFIILWSSPQSWANMCANRCWEYTGKSDLCKRHIGTNLELGHAKEHLCILKTPLQTTLSNFTQAQTRPLH